jgi:hypothetical protein
MWLASDLTGGLGAVSVLATRSAANLPVARPGLVDSQVRSSVVAPQPSTVAIACAIRLSGRSEGHGALIAPAPSVIPWSHRLRIPWFPEVTPPHYVSHSGGYDKSRSVTGLVIGHQVLPRQSREGSNSGH